MKNQIFISIIWTMATLMHILHSPVNGQEVISTAGDFHQNSNVSVSWTIGELMIETYTTSNVVLTQGFQQPILVSVSIYENPELNFEISAFPNPTSDFLNIVISDGTHDNMMYYLFDLTGKLLESRQIVTEQTEITFAHLPVAVYYVKIQQNDQELKTFKVVKQ